MATFGQGINANLGAIDYSAYQRGATQGAQSIGQGLAGLGQGVKNYFKEQEENKSMMGDLTATNAKTLEEASKDPIIAKALAGLNAGKSPNRKDLIYATAKIANLEKNEMREYQRFIQDTEKTRIAEQDRERNVMKFIIKPTSEAEETLLKTGRFEDLKGKSFDKKDRTIASAIELGFQNNLSPKAMESLAGLLSLRDKSKLESERLKMEQAEEDFEPSIFSQTLNGKTYNFARTSKNSAQYIPGETSDKAPAGVKNAEYREKKLKEARVLYRSGDVDSAFDIVQSINLLNSFKEPVGRLDMPDIFGPLKEEIVVPTDKSLIDQPKTPGEKLPPEVAAKYLLAANKDKDKARELARKDGWTP